MVKVKKESTFNSIPEGSFGVSQLIFPNEIF